MTPTRRLMFLVAAGIVPVTIGIWVSQAMIAGVLWNLALALVASVDALWSRRATRLSVERTAPDVLTTAAENEVQLTLRNATGKTVVVEVADDPPVDAIVHGLPVTCVVTGNRATDAHYRVTPRRRGRVAFGAVHLRIASRLGLWWLHERHGVETPVRVYPDIGAVGRFELLALRNRLDEAGLRVFRLKGRGGEFDRLREYRREDEVRAIDWKATAKHRRAIAREYTTERNQNIVMLLDCGSSMLNETDGIPHLDHAIDAAIMLTHVALGQGDTVSLVAFSNRIERVVGPLRGRNAVGALVRGVYDLDARPVASDYDMALAELLTRQRKRALVVLITHTLDERHVEALGVYLRQLTTPHLLLCVFLRDHGLADLADRVPEHPNEAFETAAAATLLNAQTRAIKRLDQAGALVLEPLPSMLTPELVNRYLELKAKQRL